MKSSPTLEERLLSSATAQVLKFAAAHPQFKSEARFQILEAAASRLGGFQLQDYQASFGIKPIEPSASLLAAARDLVSAIESSGVPPALALSALAREDLADTKRREHGAFHTDFRLAQHLANAVRKSLLPGFKVIDPACGAGMLLAAVSLAACGPDRLLAADWLRESVYAADLSADALRGTLIALASLTDDVNALKTMRSRWMVQDSLMATEAAWNVLSPNGFDLVVANPPWEKVKLSRHEFIKRRGGFRHYGADYKDGELFGYEADRAQASDRSALLVSLYPTLAAGEPDLYVAFTELLLKLTRPGGVGAILAPGGLIRSKNTEALRRLLLKSANNLSVTVLENRARFFSIDTRFKFVLLQFDRAKDETHPKSAIRLSHATGTASGVAAIPAVPLNRATLEEISPDLTVPEVRTPREWRLYQKMQRNGVRWDIEQSSWHPVFCREVDMTRASPEFLRRAAPGAVPVVEGRMVQPHRFGAKAYEGGTGRSARWSVLPVGFAGVAPQFWLPRTAVPASASRRLDIARAGFCDITGQTNERSMMAALIRPGSVCGNKVPTVLFPNDPSEERTLLWLSLVNSIPFDWCLRRVVTTTVNYFLLLGLRLPNIAPDSLPGQRLVDIARRLNRLDSASSSSEDLLWRVGSLRAEADALVATACRLTQEDVLLMFEDFPLLDRGQPPVLGEARSTVTRDAVLAAFTARRRGASRLWAERLSAAKNQGAIPYVPGESTGCIEAIVDAA